MRRVPLSEVKVIGCGHCGAGPVRGPDEDHLHCEACEKTLEKRDLGILGHTGRTNELGFPEIGIVAWCYPELRQ